MKRVLHIFNSTIVSGPETLVMPALGRLREYNVDAGVVILTETRRAAESARVVEYARKLGLETHEIPVRSRVDGEAIRRLAALFDRLRPQVAHSHDVKASTYTLKAAHAAFHRPHLVSTHHGVRGRSGPRARIYEWYYSRFVLPGFDRVLAVCTSDRGLLLGRGLASEKVIAHRNGVDRPRISPEERGSESARIRSAWKLAERGIPPETTVIGFVGRIAPEKRIDRILKIMAHLRDGHPGLPAWKLVIFGTGPLEAPLKAETARLGLDGQVAWMGYRAGVGSEVAGMDLLIAMSDAEGLPINIVEAGWAGTPVLATGVDGILDLVPTAEHGTLVKVEDDERAIAGKLAELLRDGPRLRRMGRNFQAHVEKEFSGTGWLRQLAGIYSDLARSAPQSDKMRVTAEEQ